MMDPEDILKQNTLFFCKNLEAKPLMHEIGHIFPTSTKQEIERVIDREGNLIALEMIISKLPLRDNWIKVFYNALKGKEINKPKLAELFEPFINKEDDIRDSLSLGHGNSLEPSYSLRTCLRDIPSVMTKWESYIIRYDLHPETALGTLMDRMYCEDKNAYTQLKRELRIEHSYVRQATLSLTDEMMSAAFIEGSFTNTSQSLPAMSDTQNSTLSSSNSDFQQSGIAPMREIIDLQKKALEKTTSNQAEDFTSLPEAVYNQKEPFGKLAVDHTSESNLTNHVRTFHVTEDRDSTKSLPIMTALTHEEKILEIGKGKREVSVAGEGKREVSVASEGKREVSVASEGKREVSVASEGEREVSVASEGEREVSVASEGERVAPEAGEGERVAPEAGDGERVAPEAGDGERVAPEAGDGERVAPEADDGERVAPEADDGERVAPEAGETREPDTTSLSSYNSLPTERNRETFSKPLYLSFLVIGMTLSFSLGYFLKRR